MENNYFLFSRKGADVDFERFHICTWEFKNNTSIIEIGGEIKNKYEVLPDEILFSVYIPWISERHSICDLYNQLRDSENCKFIFNDAISETTYLYGGDPKDGVIQHFVGRSSLCILPIKSSIVQEKRTINISINTKPLKGLKRSDRPNLYFRFYIETNIDMISTRKNGITKSSIIYDFKINEKRNLPANHEIDLQNFELSNIANCFCFTILPNSYELAFFDNVSLKNIRTLEYASFQKYLGDRRVLANEYVVVFNKKSKEMGYCFFSVFTKERIGAGQFALAILVNMVSGVLLFLPNFRIGNNYKLLSFQLWWNLPIEVHISLFLGFIIILYFVWPILGSIIKKHGSDK